MGYYTLDTRREDAFHPYKTGFTDEQLYWLGWMASDGCVHLCKDKYYRISLKLESADKYKVEQFKNFIGAVKVHKVKNQNAYQVLMISNYMGEYLIKLGITECKSYTLKVDDRLTHSPIFWRGVFEGDGNINWQTKDKYWRFSITSGSHQFLQQWCKFIQLSESYIYPCRNHYYFQIAKQEEVIKILHTLYNQPGIELRLERKWVLVDECLCQLDTQYLIAQLNSLK